MRVGATAMVVMLLAVVFVAYSPVPAIAQTHPSLATDQALYTLRDKQILLQGDGYIPKQDYVVWLQTPLDNSTQNSGLTFAATDKGQVPPAISVPIDPSSPLGTYLVSISNSTKSDVAIARAHYGIWGTDKYVYERTEVVQAKGGGVLPNTSLKVTIRDPTAAFVYDSTIAANETGSFLATWKIQPNAITESYTIFIDGVGTYDSPNAEFVSISKFSVTSALLNVTVAMSPSSSYERTQTASAELAIQYPDSTAVTTMKDGLKPITLYAGQFKIADLSLAVSGTTSGIWIVKSEIPMNASLDLKYKFMLPANAFDDGNGNVGPEKDVETESFSALPATLLVNQSLNSTHYQVPFDTLIAYVGVSYPDGTSVTNATVRAWLVAADSKVNATVARDNVNPVWIVKYAFSWGDLLRIGNWVLFVEATDIYGNTGSGSTKVSAEPYTLLEILIAAAIVVFIVRWLLLRFWRRLYLGTRRVMSVIRARLRPPSVGRYLNRSPVTP
jgi:hypothetical protein